MASFRQAFRNLNTPLRSAFRPSAFRQTFRQQTRKQTTAAAEDASAEQSKIGAFWNSHVGPKTVHFWAPIAKVRVALHHILAYNLFFLLRILREEAAPV